MLDSSLTLAVIGSGTMGEAILRGLLASGKLKPNQIVATDRRAQVVDHVRATHGVRATTSNVEACRDAGIVLLAVKPHEVSAVVDSDEMRKLLSGKVVISIAAGVRLNQLAGWLPGSAVIRAMPNTPCLIGEGMTVIARGAGVTDVQAGAALEIFRAVGRCIEMDDKLMDGDQPERQRSGVRVRVPRGDVRRRRAHGPASRRRHGDRRADVPGGGAHGAADGAAPRGAEGPGHHARGLYHRRPAGDGGRAHPLGHRARRRGSRGRRRQAGTKLSAVFDFRPLLTAEGLISLVSLVALEIVLGVDNIVFIAIVSERVAPERRPALRRLGVGLALIMRLVLLGSLSWLMGLTRPLFGVAGVELSGRDLVLLAGGLFLVAKSAHEMFQRVEDHAPGAGSEASGVTRRSGNFGLLLAQILTLDIVFSLDSVITAVGMARQLSIMATAVVIAVAIMLLAANAVSEFITRHPSLKVLALSFLLMVGVLLIADAFGKHIPKGYVYFAMAYALGVELINIRRHRKRA